MTKVINLQCISALLTKHGYCIEKLLQVKLANNSLNLTNKEAVIFFHFGSCIALLFLQLLLIEYLREKNGQNTLWTLEATCLLTTSKYFCFYLWPVFDAIQLVKNGYLLIFYKIIFARCLILHLKKVKYVSIFSNTVILFHMGNKN